MDEARRERVEALKAELVGDLLTTAEVADILDVHAKTVGEYIRDGRLPALNLAGAWRVSEEALREFVKTQTKPPRGGWRSHSAGSMFDRFTDGAKNALELARKEARQLSHNYIGAEHLLIALAEPESGISSQALQTHRIDAESLREAVTAKIGSGMDAPSNHLPFTPRAKKILELSLREALQLDHKYIGSEHLLLALIKEGESVGSQILKDKKVGLDDLRQTVIQLIAPKTAD